MSAMIASSPFSGLDCAGFDFTFYAGGRLDLCPAQSVSGGVKHGESAPGNGRPAGHG